MHGELSNGVPRQSWSTPAKAQIVTQEVYEPEVETWASSSEEEKEEESDTERHDSEEEEDRYSFDLPSQHQPNHIEHTSHKPLPNGDVDEVSMASKKVASEALGSEFEIKIKSSKLPDKEKDFFAELLSDIEPIKQNPASSLPPPSNNHSRVNGISDSHSSPTTSAFNMQDDNDDVSAK